MLKKDCIFALFCLLFCFILIPGFLHELLIRGILFTEHSEHIEKVFFTSIQNTFFCTI